MRSFVFFECGVVKKTLVVAFLLCAGLVAFCGGKKDKGGSAPAAQDTQTAEQKVEQKTEQEASPASPAAEETVPDLTLNFKGTDLASGMDVDQKAFAPAKLTLVNIWGTFCPPCLEEMPDLEKLSKQVMWQRVQVVGILCDAFAGSSRNVELAKKIIREKNVAYRNFIVEKDTPWLSGVQAVPTSYIVDPKGKVVAGPIVGSRSAAEYKAIIDKALEDLKK